MSALGAMLARDYEQAWAAELDAEPELFALATLQYHAGAAGVTIRYPGPNRFDVEDLERHRELIEARLQAAKALVIHINRTGEEADTGHGVYFVDFNGKLQYRSYEPTKPRLMRGHD